MELRDDIMRKLLTPKNKDEQLGTDNVFIMNKLRKKELITTRKTRIRIIYAYPSSN
jgi:hypothetical protein